MSRYIGWHGDVFVLPDRQYGQQSAQAIVVEGGPTDHPFTMKGTLAGWQAGVAAMCVGNSRLVHAVCAGFAGPMLRFYHGATNPGFHQWGKGSVGKTATSKVAGSVCGGKDRATGFSNSWRSTDNALEGTAKLHNHGLLCLDEIKQLDPRKIVDVIHLLGNGSSKERMKRDGGQRETSAFQLVTLSNGEKPISDIVARSGAKGVGEAGQTVRLIDIPAVPEGGHGVFENIHGFAGGGAFADHLMKATRADYGYPLHDFLTKLVTNMVGVSEQYCGKVTEILAKFTRGIPSGDGEALRVAESFAILAAAGEVASWLGITGWSAGTAEWGCGKCFKDWLKIHGTGSTDDTAALEWFQLLLERDGASRFRGTVENFDLSDGDDLEISQKNAQVRDMLGFTWREKEDNIRMFLLTPAAFKAECIAEGHSLEGLLKQLDENKMLVKDEGRRQYSKKIDKSRIRGYAIRIPEDDAEELAA